MFEMNLENYIDKLLDKYLQAKDLKRFQKRIEKEMERGIVVGIPDKSYSVWRFKMPLANYLKNASGLQIIKMALINEIIPSLTKDKIIMNTNIPEKLLKEAGLKENHYAKIVYKDSSQRADNKKTQRKL